MAKANRIFIVIGPNAWGRGETVKEAKAQCKRNLGGNSRLSDEYLVYDCPPGTAVNSYGQFTYGMQYIRSGPKLVKHMRKGKEIKHDETNTKHGERLIAAEAEAEKGESKS